MVTSINKFNSQFSPSDSGDNKIYKEGQPVTVHMPLGGIDDTSKTWAVDQEPIPFVEHAFFSREFEKKLAEIELEPISNECMRLDHLRAQDFWALNILQQKNTKILVLETSKKFVSFVERYQEQIPVSLFSDAISYLKKDMEHTQYLKIY